jgi:hypothetical protein
MNPVRGELLNGLFVLAVAGAVSVENLAQFATDEPRLEERT